MVDMGSSPGGMHGLSNGDNAPRVRVSRLSPVWLSVIHPRDVVSSVPDRRDAK